MTSKASERCTLCSLETALVIFTPGGKVITLGHPGVDAIFNQVTNGEKLDFSTIQRCDADHEAIISHLNRQYSDLLEQLEAGKKRAEKQKQATDDKKMIWLGKPFEDFNLEELESMNAMFTDVRMILLKQIEKAYIQRSTPTSTSAANSNLPLTIQAEGCSSNPYGHDVGQEN